MDERQVRELLSEAAEDVRPSADLAARAQHRYLQRRARSRALAAAVVIVVIGSAFAATMLVGRDRSATPVVGSTPTTRVSSNAVNPRDFMDLSFVNANVGFALMGRDGEPLLLDLARTDDGGRSWRHVGSLRQGQLHIHFENANDGVAYGNGPLEVTTDGGRHWTETVSGPQHGAPLAWSGGRLWSLTSCQVGPPCRELQMSDDAGLSWTTASPFPRHDGEPSIAAVSRSTVYLAFSAKGVRDPEGYFAYTNDAGRTWNSQPAPCGSVSWAAPGLAVSRDGKTVLYVCTDEQRSLHAFVSDDRGGHTWTSAPGLPDGTLTAVAPSVDSGFFVGLGGSWKKGAMYGPYPGQWAYHPTPEPVGAVRAIDAVPGTGWFFATESGVWFRSEDSKWELRAPAPVSTATTTTATTTAPTTTTTGPADSVTVTGTLRSLSFVDANVGFGLSGTDLVSTQDGGRTWRRVGAVLEVPWLHFETPKNGVAWGSGPLEVTTDGGVHWKTSDGPVDNELAWSSGRLWALTPCVQSTPCGSRPMLISDDAGTTWTPTAPLRMGFGGATIVATSRSTTYVLEPSGDTPGSQLQIAFTNDGGDSWSYESVPCTNGDNDQLASNGRTLLLECPDATASGVMQLRHVFVSSDEGKSWTRVPDQLAVGNVGQVATLGTIYMTGMGRGSAGVSSDDGRSWTLPFPLPPDEGGVSFTSLPGVGAWSWVGGVGDVWFSADGEHWEQRAPGS